ncbi:MAG: hypothetical protein ACQERF_07795 [Actinomycetota bacterium]
MTGPGCEPYLDGFLQEPIAAISSLIYIVAALLARRAPVPYAVLVAGIGIGSFVQHGPNPPLADLIHDLPLAGTLAFVAADAVARLSGRSRRWWWWAAPTGALVPVILLAPGPADLIQVGMAVVAIGLTIGRAHVQPSARRRILLALGLLAVGGVIGRLSVSGGPLCDPESLLQGHAVWHVLSAAGLLVLAPVLTGPKD